MARISVNNGNSFCTPEEALNVMSMETISEYMDDGIREAIHREMLESEVDFLEKYLKIAEDDLIIG